MKLTPIGKTFILPQGLLRSVCPQCLTSKWAHKRETPGYVNKEDIVSGFKPSKQKCLQEQYDDFIRVQHVPADLGPHL